jgi:hypothetical protein
MTEKLPNCVSCSGEFKRIYSYAHNGFIWRHECPDGSSSAVSDNASKTKFESKCMHNSVLGWPYCLGCESEQLQQKYGGNIQMTDKPKAKSCTSCKHEPIVMFMPPSPINYEGQWTAYCERCKGRIVFAPTQDEVTYLWNGKYGT